MRISSLLTLCVIMFLWICAPLSVDAVSTDDPQSGPINVFLVPHSHCSKAVKDDKHEKDIALILDNALEALARSPLKRFAWSDITSLSKWWSDLSQDRRILFRSVLRRNQFEIVGGGWVMPDEAVSSTRGFVEDMVQGHKWVRDNLGVTPKTSWQIDSFGVSSLPARLFALMDFKYHVVNRVDDRLKNIYPDISGSGRLKVEKKLEYFWDSHSSFEKTSIFTHILDSGYTSPMKCWMEGVVEKCLGFDYEGDPSKNPPVTPDNIAKIASVFSQIVHERSSYYRTNNLLMPFGGDMRFKNADIEFHNMDALIDFINRSPSLGIKISYATPSEYFKALEKHFKDDTFPRENINDFLPYASCTGDKRKYGTCAEYWTGYYSNFPLFRQTLRAAESLLHAGELVYATSLARHKYIENIWRHNKHLHTKKPNIDWEEYYDDLVALRRAVALAQNHDALGGMLSADTIKSYMKVVKKGAKKVSDILEDLVPYLTINTKSPRLLDLDLLCPYSTIDVPNPSKKSNLLPLVMINPLEIAAPGDTPISFYTSSPNFQIVDVHGKDVKYHLWKYSDFLGKSSEDKYRVWVGARVEGWGLETLVLQPTNNISPHLTMPYYMTHEESFVMENEFMSVLFGRISSSYYEMQSVFLKDSNSHIPVRMKLLEYQSWDSNAQVFRPRGIATAIDISSPIAVVYNGSMVTEFHQHINPSFSVIYRLFHSPRGSNLERSSFLEVEYSGKASRNKEVVTRFVTQIQDWKDNPGIFYTDNGIDFVPRNRTTVRYGDMTVTSEIAGSYYPVKNAMYLRDSSTGFLILTSQSMGGSSLNAGNLELMLDRGVFDFKAEDDDDKKINPSISMRLFFETFKSKLSENPDTSSKDSPLTSSSLVRDVVPSLLRLRNPVLIFASDDTLRSSFGNLRKEYVTKIDALKAILPKDVHVMDLRVQQRPNNNHLDEARTVVRLINMFGATGAHARMSSIWTSGYTMKNVKRWSLSELKVMKRNINDDLDFEFKGRSIQTYSLDLLYTQRKRTVLMVLAYLFVGYAAVVALVAMVVGTVYVIRQRRNRVGYVEIH